MNLYERLKKSLDMKYNPVGVKLIFDTNENEIINDKFKIADELLRYCEFVKRASQGEFLKLKKGDFSCVTGEIMLGFKEPELIEIERRLKFKGLKNILLFPINLFNKIISVDCIILIVTPRNCMDIAEAYTKLYDKSLKIEIGTQSGICSDITAFVIKREEINFSFLCVGSRIYAGYDDSELLCGIPAKMAKELIKEIINISVERKADIELVRQLQNYEK